MKAKHLIAVVCVCLMMFSGALWAKELVGESIFTSIETPHPYPIPQVEAGVSPVWSEVIHMPGAKWLKVHFKDFQLNDEDFVDLMDANGRLIERIRGKDVSNNKESQFRLEINGNKRVSFWGPAINGEKISVQLYRTSPQDQDWGFVIDEIGIGCKPIFDRGLGPLYNSAASRFDKYNLDKNNLSPVKPFFNKRRRIGKKNTRTLDIYKSESGTMLYRDGLSWFCHDGYLPDPVNNLNEFVPHEPLNDGQNIVDSLEVRFYLDFSLNGEIITSQYSHFCSDHLIDHFKNDFGMYILKDNRSTWSVHADGTLSRNFGGTIKKQPEDLSYPNTTTCGPWTCGSTTINNVTVTCTGPPGKVVCAVVSCSIGGVLQWTVCCCDSC